MNVKVRVVNSGWTRYQSGRSVCLWGHKVAAHEEHHQVAVTPQLTQAQIEQVALRFNRPVFFNERDIFRVEHFAEKSLVPLQAGFLNGHPIGQIKTPLREGSIERGLIHQADANFPGNLCAQVRIFFKDPCDIRQILLALAPPAFRIQGSPNLSLQHIFQTRDRQCHAQHRHHAGPLDK
jgi:hypothetical protein